MSCEAKKKQYACPTSGINNHYGGLITWMAALKFINAVSEPLIITAMA